MQLLRENVNAAIVLGGFLSLEAGIALHWSGPVAAMVGGALLMMIGLVPYGTRYLWAMRKN